MKVLALVPYPEESAGTRYRIGQFAPALSALGAEVTIAPMLDAAAFGRLYRPGGVPGKALDFVRAAARRGAAIDRAGAYDAVFVHREVWPLRLPALERRLLARNRRIVFDFDDAIFLPNVSAANRALGFLKAPEKSAWLAGHARALTAGNAFLEDWAHRHAAPDARVFAVPTAVDTARWRPQATPQKGDGLVRLGWIGSHSTMPFLESLAPVIEALGARHPELRLTVIGATTDRFAGMLETIPWTLEGEVEALDRIDIGLAPLPDSDWARGKCGLKLIQYLALEKPVVASAVGVHPEMIEHGAQGLLVDRPGGWIPALERLIADKALRRSMGARGRVRVIERYSVDAVAPRLFEALRYAAGRP